MEYAFKKGLDQLPVNKVQEVKARIMGIFKIRGYVSWYSHLYGKIEPKISEYKAIEELFKEYGITDIWG